MKYKVQRRQHVCKYVKGKGEHNEEFKNALGALLLGA